MEKLAARPAPSGGPGDRPGGTGLWTIRSPRSVGTCAEPGNEGIPGVSLNRGNSDPAREGRAILGGIPGDRSSRRSVAESSPMATRSNPATRDRPPIADGRDPAEPGRLADRGFAAEVFGRLHATCKTPPMQWHTCRVQRGSAYFFWKTKDSKSRRQVESAQRSKEPAAASGSASSSPWIDALKPTWRHPGQ